MVSNGSDFTDDILSTYPTIYHEMLDLTLVFSYDSQ